MQLRSSLDHHEHLIVFLLVVIVIILSLVEDIIVVGVAEPPFSYISIHDNIANAAAEQHNTTWQSTVDGGITVVGYLI